MIAAIGTDGQQHSCSWRTLAITILCSLSPQSESEREVEGRCSRLFLCTHAMQVNMRRFYLMDRSGAGALAHLALWRRGAEITVRYLAPRRDAKLRFPPVPESAVPVECSVYPFWLLQKND